MITKAADAFADAIMAKSKEYDNLARVCAVSYAQSDNKADQAQYRHYAELSEIFRKLHADACHCMHAVEREMQERAKSQADGQPA